MGVTVTDVYCVLHRFASDRWSVLIRVDDCGVPRTLDEEVGPAQTAELALAMIVTYLADWLAEVEEPFPGPEQSPIWFESNEPGR